MRVVFLVVFVVDRSKKVFTWKISFSPSRVVRLRSFAVAKASVSIKRIIRSCFDGKSARRNYKIRFERGQVILEIQHKYTQNVGKIGKLIRQIKLIFTIYPHHSFNKSDLLFLLVNIFIYGQIVKIIFLVSVDVENVRIGQLYFESLLKGFQLVSNRSYGNKLVVNDKFMLGSGHAKPIYKRDIIDGC